MSNGGALREPAPRDDRAARFELRISVVSGESEQDLIIDASETDTVADLTAALAERGARDRDQAPWCERRGVALDPQMPLARTGIRWGDRLRLGLEPRDPTQVGVLPRIEVVVTGGPCSGQSWRLGDGEYHIGRDPSSRLHVVDPSLSREHASINVHNGSVTITDLGSLNGVAIDGRAITPGTPHPLLGRHEVELGRTMIRIRSLNAPAAHDLVERRGRIEFNRPPRVNPPVAPFAMELPAPPSRARKVRLPLAASAAPLVLGLVMFLVLKSPFMLIMCGLSPIMAVTTYISDRRGGNKSFARSSSDFHDRVAAAAQQLDAAIEAETAQRRRDSPDTSTLFGRVRELEPTLWERRPSDRDFLCLRIGVADLPSRARVTIADGGDDELRAAAEETFASRQTVPSVPLTVDLRVAVMIGLAGPRRVTEGVARALLLQAAALHSPAEIAVAAALSEGAAANWSWLKWIPHLANERIGLQRPISEGTAETQDLLIAVRTLIADRRAQAAARDAPPRQRTTLLLLIDEDVNVDRSLVSASLADAAEYGVVAIWLGHGPRNLPGQTGSIIEVLDDRWAATVTDVASGAVTQDVTLDGVEPEAADGVARMLAPVQDISEMARTGDIPPRISLLELLGIAPVTATGLERRWQHARGRLDATIGVGVDGPFTIDLRTDGPHALIAGTTGSGKSELLRTFVAAAAATVPPDRLIFLLIDYKGGSAFAPCAGLPHVVDVVSDLDEHLAERALISLEAELKQRERILATNGVKDLQELHRKAPDQAPPMLVIAVDEFAKLREEVPEFVDGVVDIAQRGRSLGVHMVLAAQTLRNAFTPAIRANTNLRIALRVAETGESEDVIASSVAARIPSGERYRGRAFARTGHSELHEFQTAYVSGRTVAAAGRGLDVTSFGRNGRDASPDAASAGFDTDDDSDLTALGTAATEAQARLRLAPRAAPWLPPLPELLSLDSLPAAHQTSATAVIGLIDRPQEQRQDPLVVDLAAVGHVAVFGAGGSGKTTLLTTLALALSRGNSPESLRIFGLDPGSEHLAGIESLPHCGGVIRMDDEERVDRLFRELVRRVEGAGRDHGGGPSALTRRTVVLLDDLGTFASMHDRPGADSAYQQLQRVLAAGRAAGVHVVITVGRRGALPSTLSAHIGQRLILRMPTEEELLSMGLNSKQVKGAKLPPGRGFTQESEEFQVATPTGAEADRLVAAGGRSYGRPLGDERRSVTRIEKLPLAVDRSSLTSHGAFDAIPLGISDSDLAAASIDLSDSHFVVVGPYRSGRSTALATIAAGIRSASPDRPLFLLAPRRSPLRALDWWKASATTVETCAQAVDGLLHRLEPGGPAPGAAVVFIDDAGELSDPVVSARLERIVKAGRDGDLTIVAAVETSAARGIAVPWLRELRRDGHGLLLMPDLMGDGDLLGVRLPRRVAAPLVPGRGFLVRRGAVELVQVAI